jgi:Mg-chelatase subunit ChlD/uncharacterized membrane protein
MTFAHPWGLALLALAIPVVALHILRPRRQAVRVSSTFLWRGVERPVSSATPWQRLRWSALLLAQLLAVALGALAVAQPVRLTEAPLAEHTVFIIDTSGSMAAIDGAPDRVDAAKAEAERLRDELPTGGIASVVVAGQRPRVVLTASGDRQAFSDALATISAEPGSADFGDAFSLAQSLETASADIGFVLLSDGGLTQAEQQLQPPGTTYRRIGSRDTNRTITLLTVEQRGSGLHARATVENTGGPTTTATLRFDVDGVTASSHQVELKPGVAIDVDADVPAGDRVEAFLDGGDLLAADDHAVAVAGRRPDLDVLLVGDPLFVGDLLASIPGVTVTEADTADPSADLSGAGHDLVVYDQVAVPADVAVPYLAIAPPGGAPGVAVTGVLDQPAVTLLRSDDPLLEGLDLTTVGIAAAQQVDAPLADELVGAEGGPLLLRGTTPTADGGSVPFTYLTFALADSNLPVQLVFPLLGDRIVTDLAGAGVPSTSLAVGAELPVPVGRDVVVVAPDGSERTVVAGDATPRATRAGFWAIRDGDAPERLVAVNVPSSESALAPADELVKPPAVARADGAPTPRGEESLVHWVIAALLVVLVAEFLLARRRVGVGRTQWRVAVGARLVVVALLAGALLAPVVRRPTDRTATVFVVDLSASMGAEGRRAAIQWVQEAMSARGDDDLAAVVGFGGDARLDRLLQRSSTFDTPAVVVDSSATNLQAALRLADAVLPDDARRRVVVVSDGRATTGDAAEQAEAMRDRGTQVDVHTVERRAGDDAAIASIDAPTLTREGESVRVVATVEATDAGPAAVVLRRDGAEVARQTVDLVPGDNDVAFEDVPAAAPGSVVRYQVSVQQGGDTQPENDTAYAAVPVEGPARVLVVEGTEGEGVTLAGALRSGGLTVDVVDVADLPDVQTLVSYSSVVMVDVDARTLSGRQLEALSTAVRDLGCGLVTVGGERSYGVGGYRGSPLEELLPVISEVNDPKRRKTVAEVLSIDTSGSMSSCHCDEGENPAGRIGGGVNKTDISRAAAARTVEALSESDQIGILAWNAGTKWVVPLQQLPADEVVEEGLRELTPAGSTSLALSLDEAAAALRDSKAGLKHIILFSDGFTSVEVIEGVADEAADLWADDGITVSVIATGEGAAPSLEDIAVAGHGRFYPGRDLQQVPQVIAEEAVIASRDFITEGRFLPEITAATDTTEALTASPELLGYVATTAKGTATTEMRIGPDRDPLLATWQTGLGQVTSWTSDASAAWSKEWAAWDGYVGFWSSVVKDTFPAGDTAGAVRAQLSDGRLSIEVSDDRAFPDGATATAIVAGPDGQRTEVPLERTAEGTFAAEVEAPRTGTYAVGVDVRSGSDTVLSSAALASESYPAEYRPGGADAAALARVSALTGGRGEIEPAQAFDRADLVSGSRAWHLQWPMILMAALLWPLAVALSRWSLRGATVAGALTGVRRRARSVTEAVPRLLPKDPGEATPSTPPPKQSTSNPATSKPAPPKQATPKRAAAPHRSMEELLSKKRARREGADPDQVGDER